MGSQERVTREAEDERRRAERQHRHKIQLEQQMRKRKQDQTKQQSLQKQLATSDSRLAHLEEELRVVKDQRNELEQSVVQERQKVEEQRIRFERMLSKERQTIKKQDLQLKQWEEGDNGRLREADALVQKKQRYIAKLEKQLDATHHTIGSLISSRLGRMSPTSRSEVAAELGAGGIGSEEEQAEGGVDKEKIGDGNAVLEKTQRVLEKLETLMEKSEVVRNQRESELEQVVHETKEEAKLSMKEQEFMVKRITELEQVLSQERSEHKDRLHQLQSELESTHAKNSEALLQIETLKKLHQEEMKETYDAVTTMWQNKLSLETDKLKEELVLVSEQANKIPEADAMVRNMTEKTRVLATQVAELEQRLQDATVEKERQSEDARSEYALKISQMESSLQIKDSEIECLKGQLQELRNQNTYAEGALEMMRTAHARELEAIRAQITKELQEEHSQVLADKEGEVERLAMEKGALADALKVEKEQREIKLKDLQDCHAEEMKHLHEVVKEKQGVIDQLFKEKEHIQVKVQAMEDEYMSEIDSLKNELAQVKVARSQDTDEQIKILQSSYDQKKKELMEEKAKIESNLQELQAEHRRTLETIGGLERDFNETRVRLESQTKRVEETERALEEAKQTRVDMEDSILQARDQMEEYQTVISKLQHSVSQYREKEKTWDTSIKELRAANESSNSKDQVKELEKERHDLLQRIHILEERAEKQDKEWEKSLHDSHEQNKELEMQAGQAKAKVADLKEELGISQGEVERLTNRLNNMKEKFVNTNGSMAKELDQTKSELRRVKDSYEELFATQSEQEKVQAQRETQSQVDPDVAKIMAQEYDRKVESIQLEHDETCSLLREDMLRASTALEQALATKQQLSERIGKLSDELHRERKCRDAVVAELECVSERLVQAQQQIALVRDEHEQERVAYDSIIQAQSEASAYAKIPHNKGPLSPKSRIKISGKQMMESKSENVYL